MVNIRRPQDIMIQQVPNGRLLDPVQGQRQAFAGVDEPMLFTEPVSQERRQWH